MAGKKETAEKAIPVTGNLICRDCGALVDVNKKPSIVYCPKCGMNFTIKKSFKPKT